MHEASAGLTFNSMTVLRKGPNVNVRVVPKDESKSAFVVSTPTWVLKCGKCSCEFLYTEGKEKGMIDELYMKHTCAKKNKKKEL